MPKQRGRVDAHGAILLLAAAAILRNRLVVVDSLSAAKSFMESSTTSGQRRILLRLHATRIIGQQGVLHEGLVHSAQHQVPREHGTESLSLPMTSIIGTALTRSGGVSLGEVQ
jgi:hypothetical protein